MSKPDHQRERPGDQPGEELRIPMEGGPSPPVAATPFPNAPMAPPRFLMGETVATTTRAYTRDGQDALLQVGSPGIILEVMHLGLGEYAYLIHPGGIEDLARRATLPGAQIWVGERSLREWLGQLLLPEVLPEVLPDVSVETVDMEASHGPS